MIGETAIGALLAIFSGIAFGVGNTFAKVGLQSVKTTPGTMLSLVASLAVALIVALVFEFKALISVSLVAIGWFALIGILYYTMGRLFLFQGIRILGAARATSISCSSPLFSAVLAFAFLKETLTTLIIIGTLSIVGGLYLLLSEGSKASTTKKGRVLGYGFGLATALCWAVVSVLIKYVVSKFASPLVCLTFSLLFGTLVLFFATGMDFEIGNKINKRAVSIILLAGFIMGIGSAAFYSAFSMTTVIIVAPLAGINPLIATLCTYLFLQRLERIGPRVVISCFLVVIGGTLIVTGSPA